MKKPYLKMNYLEREKYRNLLGIFGWRKVLKGLLWIGQTTLYKESQGKKRK